MVQQSENEMKQSFLTQIDRAAVLKEELTALLTKIEQKTHPLDGLKIRRPIASQAAVMENTAPQEMNLSDAEKDLLNALNELK